MDFKRAQKSTAERFRESIVPRLCDYIRIPNKSPLFDANWQKNGHMERAAELMAGWCREQPIQGLKVEILRAEGRTPLLFCEIPGSGEDTALLYGHMDKQPEFTGWAEGLSPWEPVLRDGKLYGRGGADDGYAVFSSLTAIRLLQEQGIAHARCVVLIEACEESGSYDLPYYVDQLAARIGTPSLVVCLDAECGNFDQLWCTTSLRGNLVGTLTIEGLTEGVHSGAGTGIAPSVFRIARSLLARVENDVTGDLMLEELYAPIPAARVTQARAAAQVLGDQIAGKLPFVAGARPLTDAPVELVLNNTWRPTLAITGAAGLPALENAGNVLLPKLDLKLSFPLLASEPLHGVARPRPERTLLRTLAPSRSDHS
jgi:acetylornithine deacetylase/succinyl-diaminopimelate desuccinylase-like protein